MKRLFFISFILVSAICMAQSNTSTVNTQLDKPVEKGSEVKKDNGTNETVKTGAGINDKAPKSIPKEDKQETQPVTPPKSMSSDIDKPN